MNCQVCHVATKVGCRNCNTPYCSRACQRSDWVRHKLRCSSLGEQAKPKEKTSITKLEKLIEKDPIQARITLLHVDSLSYFISLLSKSAIILEFSQQHSLLRRIFLKLRENIEEESNEAVFFHTLAKQEIDNDQARNHIADVLLGDFITWAEEENEHEILFEYIKKNGLGQNVWERFVEFILVHKKLNWLDVLEEKDLLRSTYNYNYLLSDLIFNNQTDEALHLLNLHSVIKSNINQETLTDAIYVGATEIVQLLLLYQPYSTKILQDALHYAVDMKYIDIVKLFLATKKIQVTEELKKDAYEAGPQIYSLLREYEKKRFFR